MVTPGVRPPLRPRVGNIIRSKSENVTFGSALSIAIARSLADEAAAGSGSRLTVGSDFSDSQGPLAVRVSADVQWHSHRPHIRGSRASERISKDRNAAQKHVCRAEIVLLSVDGVGTSEIIRPTCRTATAPCLCSRCPAVGTRL